MNDLLLLVQDWRLYLWALVMFGFAPGFVLRLALLLYPRDDERRDELLAELYAVPRWKRPMWVAEQLETAMFEGPKERRRRRALEPRAVTAAPSIGRPMGRFLRAIAACDEDILRMCPEERFRFSGLGAVMLGTAGLSAMSMTLGLSIVFGQTVAVTVFGGLLWGSFILVLDRWLVSVGTGWRHFVPRFVVAAFFGLVVAEPVALLAFDDVVTQSIEENTTSAVAEYRTLLNKCNPAIDNPLLPTNAPAGCEDAQLTLARPPAPSRDLASPTVDHAVAQQRANDYNEARASAIDQLVDERTAELSQAPGLAKRIDALSTLMAESPTIALSRMMLALFFLAVDTSPALVRMSTTGGAYDQIVAIRLTSAIENHATEHDPTNEN